MISLNSFYSLSTSSLFWLPNMSSIVSSFDSPFNSFLIFLINLFLLASKHSTEYFLFFNIFDKYDIL